MINFTRYVSRGLLVLATTGFLAACHGEATTTRQAIASLPPAAQDYLLISSYFMAEGGLVSRLQDGGLSGQQVYDMALSLKYGKRMLMAALVKPSHRARHNVELAVALMVACTDQPDPTTLGGRALQRCIPEGPVAPTASPSDPQQQAATPTAGK
ncbi:hypothetical protein JCM25156A_21200 [Komagataeibacter kakiaceti JCM 25156]